MVKYNCKKCAHVQVCSFKDNAIKEANNFDNVQSSSLPNLERDLRCKHYVDYEAMEIARKVYDD